MRGRRGRLADADVKGQGTYNLGPNMPMHSPEKTKYGTRAHLIAMIAWGKEPLEGDHDEGEPAAGLKPCQTLQLSYRFFFITVNPL